MQKSAYNFIEYSGDQKVDLYNVISVVAYNNSETLVVVDKIVLAPGQKEIIVMPDYSISDISLKISFQPLPIKSGANKGSINEEEFSIIEGIIPANIAPNIKKTVVLYVKKLI